MGRSGDRQGDCKPGKNKKRPLHLFLIEELLCSKGERSIQRTKKKAEGHYDLVILFCNLVPPSPTLQAERTTEANKNLVCVEE